MRFAANGIFAPVAGFLGVCWVCLATALAPAAAAEEKPDHARKLLLTGKYAEAAEIYAAGAKKGPAAALGLARCLEAQGKAEEAVKTLAPLAGQRADLSAELARLAFGRGDLKEAKIRADRALELDREEVLAQWVSAELDRAAGRLDDAERGYRRLVRFYNDHDVKDAESLHWIGMAAAQYARWNRLSDQFDFLVNELYPDALKLEPSYWPAHYQSGLLFLEKHNTADAAKELKAALEINPQAAEVHAALAGLALENREIDKAESSLGRALEINPRLLDAWQLKADLAWANFQGEEALRLLRDKALPLCPVDEDTLGRMAACYLLLDGMTAEWKERMEGKTEGGEKDEPQEPARPHPSPLPEGEGKLPHPDRPHPSPLPEGEETKNRFTRLVEEVTARNPRAGDFFRTLAEMLEGRNKQAEAEVFFREAIRVMPRMIGPHAGLGMLFMRTGQEAEARKLLKEAFDADPFDVRVKNTLEVLDVLDGMKTLSTDHFLLKYDKADGLLGRYAARRLEAVYPELCKEFGYEPPGRSPVEIFREAAGHDGHQWFSARMVGLPYLGTVAASTGRIVAMASPNEPRAGRQFNWARVLKHEMVHVITLQQTRFNVPHWFTEGLAVRSEGDPRPHRWNQLLRQRVPAGKLFDLQTLNFGFTRPGAGDDWQMAYCQAELYVDFMLSLGKPDCLRQMLAAYAEGRSTDEAIRRVFGLSREEFEQGYLAHLKKTVAGLKGLKYPSHAPLADVLKAGREHPQDADRAADAAHAYVERGMTKEAKEWAEKAIKLRPKHQLATYVLARLKLRDQRTEEAVTLLETCLDRQSPDPLVLNLLAGLKLKAKKYEEAISLYSVGEQFEPANTQWTSALAKVYLLTEKRQPLRETLARLARADCDELACRKKLAEMSLEGRDYAAAADWAAQALDIAVGDAEVHRLLAESLAGRQDYPAAIEEFEAAVELAPKNLQQRLALADACVQAKQPAKARKVLEELLKLDPKYPGADVLLESLKKHPNPKEPPDGPSGRT